MKSGIHPVVFQDRSTGDAFLTRSTATPARTIEWSDGKTRADKLLQEEAVMKQFVRDAEPNAEMLRNMKRLASERGTGVEGIVLWLAISRNPRDALNELLT